jgi:excisionase family DNA binding protein
LTVLRAYGILAGKFFTDLGVVVAEKDDILLNSRQAAELLDLSPDTVNELARKNSLPAVKRGRQWRFRRRDISSFKKQMQERTAA